MTTEMRSRLSWVALKKHPQGLTRYEGGYRTENPGHGGSFGVSRWVAARVMRRPAGGWLLQLGSVEENLIGGISGPSL